MGHRRRLTANGPLSLAEAPPHLAPVPVAAPEPLTLEALYEAELEFVWRSARALGLDGAALDDDVQDVFLIAHQRLGSFEQRSSARTWLYGIARYVVPNHHRRWRRKDGLAPLPEQLESLQPGPDRETEARRAWARVERFLVTLPDEQREVFVLCDIEELSVPEVAEMVGAKLNTVYSRLRRARDAFRAALGRSEENLP